MKNVLLMLLFITSPCVQAQSDVKTYRPFVEEGKEWVVGSFSEWDTRQKPAIIDRFCIDGDTVIDGKNCMYLSWSRRKANEKRSSHVMTIPIFEDVGKVWAFTDGSDSPILLYDFSAIPGQSITLQTVIPEFIGSELWDNIVCTITSVDKYIYNGRTYIRHTFSDTYSDSSDMSYWLEGIGSCVSPVRNMCLDADGGLQCLLFCTVRDKEIYHKADFDISLIDRISGIHAAKTYNQFYYDLSGRRLAAPPAKGVYVEDRRVKVKCQ